MSHINQLHTNQKLLLKELILRWVSVNDVNVSNEYVCTDYHGHHEFIFDRYTSIIPYNYVILFSDKHLTKKVLDSLWFSCPIGNGFFPNEIEPIMNFAKTKLSPPFVIKPNEWSHWTWVIMNIFSYSELLNCIQTLDNHKQYILEEQFPWKEYRIFVTKNWKYAVLEREPAYIIWDWIHTIEEIAKNISRERDPSSTSLCPIIINQAYLQKQNLTLQNIVWIKQKVYVQEVSNIARWWVCKNVTNIIHDSYIDLSIWLLKHFPWLPYIWIDLITDDISSHASPEKYVIIECNTQPWIKMHAMPWEWISINIASYIADLIYPETILSTEKRKLHRKTFESLKRF